MQLLVSVRSGAEVEPALAGGADIIDAKEPARGSLGPVTPATLAAVLARVPVTQPFSVALGDMATAEELAASLTALALPSRPGPTYIKLGFAGVASPDRIGAVLRSAVTMATAGPTPARVVAVAYADAERAESVSPEIICRLAHTCGAAGVLMDTFVKDGSGLLAWWRPSALAAWTSEARGRGLLTALAGSLCPDDVPKLLPAAPHVLGFRGAACQAGRLGEISAQRVALLRQRIDAAMNGVIGNYARAGSGHRETRDPVAYPAAQTAAKLREFKD